MAFYQCPNIAVVRTRDQITFSMTWHCPVFNRSRTLADGYGIEDSSAPGSILG